MQMDALDRFLEELLETDLSLGTLHLVLSRLKESGRLDLVIQQGRKALNAHPDHVGLRMLLAEAYMENGLGARACEEMERAVLRLDDMAEAYRRLADMYILQGRESEAARCLSIYLVHREDDDEARETLTRILPESPEEPSPEESGARGGRRRIRGGSGTGRRGVGHRHLHPGRTLCQPGSDSGRCRDLQKDPGEGSGG